MKVQGSPFSHSPEVLPQNTSQQSNSFHQEAPITETRRAPDNNTQHIERIIQQFSLSLGDDLLQLQSNDFQENEKCVLETLAHAEMMHLLEPTLTSLVHQPAIIQFMPDMTPQQRVAYAKRLTKMIRAELKGAGYIPSEFAFKEWIDKAQIQIKKVENSAFKSRKQGEDSLLLEPEFIKEMEALTHSKFLSGQDIQLLAEGPDAAKCRKKLIQQATKSINLMAWAIYDDQAGSEIVTELIKKHTDGVKVRVLVDGQTVIDSGHGQRELARLQEHGIEVIYFKNPDRPYDGLHSKLMIVDGTDALTGGRNIGIPYFHSDPKGEKWEDMDAYFKGPALKECEQLFARIWNQQIAKQKLAIEKFIPENHDIPPQASEQSICLTSQSPGESSKILLGIMKAIAGATECINIANAYVIAFPSLRESLESALARGVKVNIYTNSPKSVDESFMVAPIMESLLPLYETGAQIFLKKGDTLHAKYMTVDKLYSNIMSYNFHPRSERYETEMSIASLNKKLANELDTIFIQKTKKAQQVTKKEELIMPFSPIDFIVNRYFYNQL